MSISRHFLYAAIVLCAGVTVPVLAAPKAAESDVVSQDKRRATLTLAHHLETPVPLAPALTDQPLPFGPPGFEQTDAEERAAAFATAMRNNQTTHVVTEREVLETIAAKLVPTGTIFSGDEPRLMFRTTTIKTGTHFTVKTPEGQDYDLELVSIDRTTFTVRHNGEEVTRPIKAPPAPSKSK